VGDVLSVNGTTTQLCTSTFALLSTLIRMRSSLSLIATFIFGTYASNVLELVPDTWEKTVFAGTPALVEL
jgi:hypothetical protein